MGNDQFVRGLILITFKPNPPVNPKARAQMVRDVLRSLGTPKVEVAA